MLLASHFLPADSSAGSTPGPQSIQLALQSVAGSSAPNLSRGADGIIILSWLEPSDQLTRLRFSRLTEAGWSTPQTLAESDNWFVNWADFPSVVAISETLWAAHWLNKKSGGRYAYDVNIALSRDAGMTWGTGITPHRDNTATEHGFVSLFPWQQGLGAVWLDGRNTVAANAAHAHDENLGAGGMTLRYALILPDGEITAEAELDSLVCDCCQTSVALARQGPVAVYRNRTRDELRDIHIARFVDGAWQAGQAVHLDGWKISGCPVNGPAVAAAGDTVVVAWFTMADDIPRVRFARSEDGGKSFPQMLDIAERTPAGRVDVALLDDGSAAISWLDEAAGNEAGTVVNIIRIRIIFPDGSLAASHLLHGDKTVGPAGFPQMVSDGNDLILAWTEILQGASDKNSSIRSARIPPASLTQPDR